MIEYMSKRRVTATPMTRQEYNDLRGWVLPGDENGDDFGYMLDTPGPAEGVPRSWVPKAVFDAFYFPVAPLPHK